MKDSSFIKDFGWYFIGSFLPLLIGLLRTPIFTRHFSREEYGYLGIITITFSYLGVVLFSWISSCIWRYYSKYDLKNNLKTLYSNLILLIFISSIFLLVISSIWFALSKEVLVKELIFYSFFYILFSQLFLAYMVVVRLKEKASFYTIINSIRAILSVGVALILVFVYNMNISALILSLAIIDFAITIFLLVINPAEIKFNIKFVRFNELKELVKYGGAGLLMNISFLTITYSDRYIIAAFNSIETVGLYDQSYRISQISIIALITVFFNTINPKLLKELEINFSNSLKLIHDYLKMLLIFGLPIIVYLSISSKDIATVFLGEEFRESFSIMPYIFVASYLHGISNFFELRLKFSNKLKRLSMIVIAVAFINVLLNYILVQFYGYKWAAITTMISYILLILFFHYYDNKVLSVLNKNSSILYKICFVLIVQIILYYSIQDIFDPNIFVNIGLVFIYLIVYVSIFKRQILNFKIIK